MTRHGDIRSQLQEDILTAAPWDALRLHAANIVVVSGISIVDAGEALANDDVEQVEAWLADGTISKPTQAQIAVWDDEAPDLVALIVQPWILVQQPSF